MNAPIKFKKIASVTLPLMKLVTDTEYYVKFLGKMSLGKEMPAKPQVDEKTGEVKLVKNEPAYVAHVLNLETGEEVQILCATVLRKELEEAYPDHAYVGKCFNFNMHKVSGKRYHLVTIAEVEIEEPAPNEPTEAKVKK